MLIQQLQFFLGVCGKPQGFRLYDATASTLLAQIGPAERAFDLTTLGLGEGRWTLGLSYVDAWGSESEQATVQLDIGAAGTPSRQLRGPRDVRAAPLASGQIRVEFSIEDASASKANPAEFEVTYQTEPATILATISFSAQTARYKTTLSASPHDTTRIVQVRATDGASLVTAWVPALPVVADAEGPAAPDLVGSTACCGCD